MLRTTISAAAVWTGLCLGSTVASAGEGLSWAAVAPALGPGAVVLGVVGLALAGWYLRKRA